MEKITKKLIIEKVKEMKDTYNSYGIPYHYLEDDYNAFTKEKKTKSINKFADYIAKKYEKEIQNHNKIVDETNEFQRKLNQLLNKETKNSTIKYEIVSLNKHHLNMFDMVTGDKDDYILLFYIALSKDNHSILTLEYYKNIIKNTEEITVSDSADNWFDYNKNEIYKCLDIKEKLEIFVKNKEKTKK